MAFLVFMLNLRYGVEVRVQPSRQEIIGDLAQMVKDLLKRLPNGGKQRLVLFVVHCGPEQRRIQIGVLGYSLVRSLVCSLTALTPELVGQ